MIDNDTSTQYSTQRTEQKGNKVMQQLNKVLIVGDTDYLDIVSVHDQNDITMADHSGKAIELLINENFDHLIIDAAHGEESLNSYETILDFIKDYPKKKTLNVTICCSTKTSGIHIRGVKMLKQQQKFPFVQIKKVTVRAHLERLSY